MTNSLSKITSPNDPLLANLSGRLRDLAPSLENRTSWPAEQLRLCGEFGVFEWFMPPEWGGQGWSEVDIVRGHLALSEACLTSTFIITQRTGACRRIQTSDNAAAKSGLLPDLVAGRRFATVGISHLTTSRRHLAKPVLRAEQTTAGFVLDGFSPWVTGAAHADTVVVGASMDDGRQLLLALPIDLPGVSIPPAVHLVGLAASQTGPVHFERVEVDRKWLLAGPVEEVMKRGIGARSGGLQTSTLAIGLATAAISYLEKECSKRRDLEPPTASLRTDCQRLKKDLLEAADGKPVCSPEELRTRANSVVLRSTQAALAAAKGSGYVVGHPAGRWCREALFFLVWSCPQPVMAANLCELAGIAE